jgi:hypothetical protein
MAAIYAVMVTYLLLCGVARRRILKIVAWGIGVGLVLACVPAVTPEIIVTYSVGAMVLAAVLIAREEILGTITPIEIIFLNIAANFAASDGPVPLSLARLVALPVRHEMLGTMLSVIVAYAPSLIVLAALHKGPPGAKWVRLLLGFWVCWVVIAAFAGPSTNVTALLQSDSPAQWLTGIGAIYAVVRVATLALNLVFLVAQAGEKGTRTAEAIRRSVRIDRTLPSLAVLCGAGFWVGMYIIEKLPFPATFTDCLGIAAALLLGSLLRSESPTGERAEAPDDDMRGETAASSRTPREPGAPAVTFALVLGVVALASFLSWLSPSPGPPITLPRYSHPEDRKLLKEHLTRAGVPYWEEMYMGEERLRIAQKHWDAASKIVLMMDGPDLPRNRHYPFSDPEKHKAFTEWLTRKGVKWEAVERRRQQEVVWEDGPGHDYLLRAFEREKVVPSAGVDYYALHTLVRAGVFPDPLPARTAAFVTPEYRIAFVTWLWKRGVDFRIVTKGGYDFVVWESDGEDLFPQYLAQTQRECLAKLRGRKGDSPETINALQRQC